jgi:RES domain-containing protein
LPSFDILEAIDALGATDWSGTTYRQTGRGGAPLSGEGAFVHGGRWNPPDSFPTIYLADSVRTCIEEARRVAARQGLDLAAYLPRDLHEVEVVLVRVLDLSADGAIEYLGVPLNELLGEDMAASQQIGQAARYLGFEGLVAPSATGAGLAIAVFEDQIRPGQLKIVNTVPLPLLSTE